MTPLERMQLRTNEPDERILEDCLESAKAAILSRRYPFGSKPSELPDEFLDLQFRISLAIYNKDGGDFETSHSENGVTRVFGSEGIPESLLSEITPLCGVV